MRILLIYLFHVICICGSRAISFETSIDDLEVSIDRCTFKGEQMKPTSYEDCHLKDAAILDEMPEGHHRFCRMAFKVSCLKELEDSHCLNGVNSARRGFECKNKFNIFEKCCIACQIGLELKAKTGECFAPSSVTDGNMKNVTFDCCNFKMDNNFYSSYETDDYNEVLTRHQETLFAETRAVTDLAPAELIASQKPSTGSTINCSTHYDICEANQECVKTRLGYECICKSGFTVGKNSECVDVDECEHNDQCLKHRKTCSNTPGSFKCDSCLSGFQNSFSNDYNLDYNELNDGDACVDIDECAAKNCSDNEVCTNVEGSFRCTEITCPGGYKKSNATSCKLKACSGRVCHKTIQFFFKAVPPKSNTTVVHEFLASKFNAAMNTEFLVIISNKNKHSLMVQKPLKRDLTVTLNIRNGRKEVIEHIHLFVSKL